MSNPLTLCYKETAGLTPYFQASAAALAGRENRADPAFAAMMAAGGEVFAYLNVIERPDNGGAGPLDRAFYVNVPLWNPPTINWPGHTLCDMSVSSPWVTWTLDYIRDVLMPNFSGVFLDVVAGRLWTPTAAWPTWPVDQQQRWILGQVDFLRRLDEMRRDVNEKFKIVANGAWHDTPADPLPVSREVLAAARSYIDGVCIEHHWSTSAFHRVRASAPYGTLGQRRVFVIANSVADAVTWSQVPGVTHVSANFGPGGYTGPTVPPVPSTDLRLGEALTREARRTLERDMARAQIVRAKTLADQLAAALG